MTVKERLIKFIKYLDIPISEFERVLSLSNGYVNNIRKSIGEDVLHKITFVYPQLNKLWLLFEEGEMLVDNTNEENNNGNSFIAKRRQLKNNALNKNSDRANQGIPIFDVPIDASFLERYNDDRSYYEPVGFLNIPKLKNCNFAAIISGNSMYPLMKSGTIAACRIVDTLDYFDEGEMYFISTSNGFETVKYVQSADNPDELKLIPHNEKIKATIIKKSMVLRMCVVEAWLNFR